MTHWASNDNTLIRTHHNVAGLQGTGVDPYTPGQITSPTFTKSYKRPKHRIEWVKISHHLGKCNSFYERWYSHNWYLFNLGNLENKKSLLWNQTALIAWPKRFTTKDWISFATMVGEKPVIKKMSRSWVIFPCSQTLAQGVSPWRVSNKDKTKTNEFQIRNYKKDSFRVRELVSRN